MVASFLKKNDLNQRRAAERFRVSQAQLCRIACGRFQRDSLCVSRVAEGVGFFESATTNEERHLIRLAHDLDIATVLCVLRLLVDLRSGAG